MDKLKCEICGALHPNNLKEYQGEEILYWICKNCLVYRIEEVFERMQKCVKDQLLKE